jgi:tRNA(fMet)-specific endonuclease VapC
MIVLDSDHCVFLLRGRADVVSAFEAHREEEPAISIISVGELYYGALRSAHPDRNVATCRALFEQLTILYLDERIMLQFGRLKATLADRGQRLPDPDLLIAATAIESQSLLVTHNTKHFRRVPELRVEDWCAE